MIYGRFNAFWIHPVLDQIFFFDLPPGSTWEQALYERKICAKLLQSLKEKLRVFIRPFFSFCEVCVA